MTADVYALRDAPKHETFRAICREMGLEIVRWETPVGVAPAPGGLEKDFLAYSSRDLQMFVLCSTPQTEPAFIDTRARDEHISIRAGLLSKGERTWQIGREKVEMRGLDVTCAFQSKGQLIRGSGLVPERSIAVQVRPGYLRKKIGDRLAKLPGPVREVIEGRRPFHRESRVTGRLLAIVSGLGDLVSGSPAFRELHAEATALGFLAAALDTLAQPAVRTLTPTPAEAARIEQVRARIDEFPARHHDIEEMARIAATNRTKLRASFKQLYGMTLSDYQTGARMRLAERRLLTTDLSLESIAHEVGYSNAASFVVAYKAFFGSTPGRARRR